MRKKIWISINMFLISLIIFLNPAVAEQRMITFEMGESGQTVSFPMSQEEIAYADSVTAYSKALKKGDDTTAKRWVDRIELPESGQFVEFLMTEKEIQDAKEKLAQENSNSTRQNSSVPIVHEKSGEIFEMADGYSIVFYNDNTSKWGHYPIQ